MSQYTDTIFDNLSNIREVADYLHTLSNALCMVGNDNLGDDLRDMSKELRGAAKGIQEGVALDINERLGAAQASVSNIITTLADRVTEG